MRILFLDDDPKRHDLFRRETIGHSVEHVHTVFGARVALDAGGVFDLACLDHDLGGHQMVDPGEDTGHAVAKYIAEMSPEKRPRHVLVHSFNPAGAVAMCWTLRNAGVSVVQIPFGQFTIPSAQEASGMGPAA